jgi:hypothetical protein
MSRGQENQVFNTSQQQNQQANQNAQTSYNNAQGDVANYQSQLANFAAANPYGEGGAYQTSENKIAANTSDAAAQAAGQAMQSEAVRTGQNSAGAIAATEAGSQANERNLSAQESGANASRITAGANYGQQVLNATAVPETMEAGLASGQNSAANAELGEEQKAGMTPSLPEELMSGVLQAGSSFAGSFGGGLGKAACWIAAELYGGWTDGRVILIRMWLVEVFRKRWYGEPVLWLYAKLGERTAAAIRRPGLFRMVFRDRFQWLFDVALERADDWAASKKRAAAATMGLEVGWKEMIPTFHSPVANDQEAL